ncbi:MAG: Hcp family type VI secretion system effector [Candidatus Rokuibacteriota bacterium]
MPPAASASPSLHIFLQLNGIAGESTDKQFPQQIEVLSYEQNVTQTIIRMGGGGMAAGRPEFPDVRFRKVLDRASPELLLACASGQRFETATFSFRRLAPARPALYTVTLGAVLITAVTQIAGAGAHYPLSFVALDTGDDRAALLDEVALAYERIEWTYQPLGKDGTASGPPVATGWDIAGSRSV